ncbi:MAG: glycosyltransferase family 4 protein [Candidatus Methanosuratincola sp.]
MRILYASQSFLPSTGGVSYYLMWLGRKLKEANHDVVFVNMKPPKGKSKEEIMGFKVYRVPPEGEFDHDILRGYSKFKEIILKVFHNREAPVDMLYNKHLYGYNEYLKVNESFQRAISEAADLEQPDVVHVHDFQLLPCLNLLGVNNWPLVFTWHIPFTEEVHPAWRGAMVEFMKNTSSAIFSTKGYASAAIKSGLPFNKVSVIPPFIDVEQPKTKFREKFGIRNDEKLIICVARMDRFKGQGTLLDAAAMLDLDYRLVFIGNGSFSKDVLKVKDKESYGKELKEKAKNDVYADRVIFAGAVDRDTLMAAYSECDLVVLPSVHEGFGLAITEGMAFGKPVIGTAVGGIPSQIWPGVNGYLVNPNDPRSLADAIRHILKNGELAEEMGRNSKAIFERYFSSKRGAEDHIGLYSRLLKFRC